MRWFDKRHLRWWWQRRRYGFDNRELWCLTSTIVKHTLPRLKAFAEVAKDHVPAHFLYRQDGTPKTTIDKAALKWQETLQKMIRAMEIWIKDDGWTDPNSDEEKEMHEGFRLFHKYFFNLWY